MSLHPVGGAEHKTTSFPLPVLPLVSVYTIYILFLFLFLFTEISRRSLFFLFYGHLDWPGQIPEQATQFRSCLRLCCL